jgi:hypothetical protein
MIVLGVLALVAWSFVDILRSDFPGGEKAVWLVLVWLMPFVGAVLYIAIGRNRRHKMMEDRKKG